MHISLKPELLFNLGPFPLTNSIFTSWISTSLLILVAILVGKNYKRLPGTFQSLFEMVYELFENLATESLGKSGIKFVPLLATFFLFIVTSNWLGVLPGVGSIGFNRELHAAAPKGASAAPASAVTKDTHAAPAPAATKDAHAAPAANEHETEFVPLFRGANADLNTTLALALISMTVIHVSGIRSAGLKHHLAHFKNPIEIVSEISKIISFAMRLFGNVFAGEVLLATMSSLLMILTKQNQIWFGIPGGLIVTPFLFLETFVGFIQAFVFSMLTLSFLSLFYKTEHSHH